MNSIQYKIPTALKNKQWPSHKKKIKLIRTLKIHFSKILGRVSSEIKLEPKINNIFHSVKVPNRRFLNQLSFKIKENPSDSQVWVLIA